MVHALKETWRVLRSGGLLLDVRPVGANRTFELQWADGVRPVGEIDTSLGQPDDEAADAAVDRVVGEGLFAHEAGRIFTVAYYWSSLADMRRHVDTEWADFASVAPDIWARATALVAARQSSLVRVVVRSAIQMTSYRKR